MWFHSTMHPVDLVGDTVRVRELRDDDFEAIRVYASDPQVHRYLIWQTDGPDDTRRWIADAAEEARALPRISYNLAIEERATGQMVGGVRLGIDSPEHRRASVGYVLRRDRWGRGYATEAARLVVGLAFETLGMHRVFAHCDVRNTGSYRVMEKIGMTREGLLREHLLMAGTWRDTLTYAILEQEWTGR